MLLDATDAIVPLLTPHGHLRLELDAGERPMPAELRQRLLQAFAPGAGHGLLHLGASEVGGFLVPLLDGLVALVRKMESDVAPPISCARK